MLNEGAALLCGVRGYRYPRLGGGHTTPQPIDDSAALVHVFASGKEAALGGG